MDTYLYETHCHSREGSACAHNTGGELVHAYSNKGYSGLILTDHFFNGNTAVPTNLPWDERIYQFMLGYESAFAASKAITLESPTSTFQVFFGWEYAYHGTEFLTYGLGKEFLLAYPNMLSWSISTYLDYVHEAGGFVSHAHPFRRADYIASVRLYPDKVDAVEVVNKSHTNPTFDANALDYANKHHLLKTSGSDTHTIHKIGGGGVTFNYPINTISEFIQGIKNGESDYIR